MKHPLTVLLGLLLAAVLGACDGSKADPQRPLALLCDAGLRPALNELLPAYTEQSGHLIQPKYAGSGLLLTRAEAGESADLFLPGNRFYVDALQQTPGRILARTDIAFLVPCLIVAKGNPKEITSLRDFARLGVQVGIGDPEACQVGRVTVVLLGRAEVDVAGLDAKLSLTVSELALWVKRGEVDAAVVWDATAATVAEAVDVVPISFDPSCVSRVTLALLAGGHDADTARDFMSFCTQPRGQGILRRKGFRIEPPEGHAPLQPFAGG